MTFEEAVVECDECGDYIEHSGNVYCDTCYDKAKDQIKEADMYKIKTQIMELRDVLEDLIEAHFKKNEGDVK